MKQNKNRLELRLDPESLELLNSLIARTQLTKTSLIKTALKVYASTLKKGHIMTIKYKSEEYKEEKPQNDDQEKSKFDFDEEYKKINEDFPFKY